MDGLSGLCLWYVFSFVAALVLSRGRAGRFALVLIFLGFVGSCGDLIFLGLILLPH